MHHTPYNVLYANTLSHLVSYYARLCRLRHNINACLKWYALCAIRYMLRVALYETVLRCVVSPCHGVMISGLHSYQGISGSADVCYLCSVSAFLKYPVHPGIYVSVHGVLPLV